jgi:hypothetical protein
MSLPDTKAAWKRRALRAEAELESLRKIRDSETDMQRCLLRQAGGFAVAISEIEDAIKAAKDYIARSAP